MKNDTLLALATLSLSLAFVASTGCGGGSSSPGTGGSISSNHASSSTTTNSSSTTTSSSSTGGGATSSSSATTSSSGGMPAPPTIGMQLDRMGRPAVNTALNHGFDGSAAAGTAKDAYNADSDPTKWAANYAAQFAGNLAIIDALDGTCGNQIGYAKPTSATSYSAIAGALADDRLYLNTAGPTHMQYLAVEANVLGVTNTDQGGRTLSEVVMDTTYSVLAAGALTGVSNGITQNDVAFSATFPYEASPH
jgi:hypothetical protein